MLNPQNGPLHLQIVIAIIPLYLCELSTLPSSQGPRECVCDYVNQHGNSSDVEIRHAFPIVTAVGLCPRGSSLPATLQRKNKKGTEKVPEHIWVPAGATESPMIDGLCAAHLWTGVPLHPSWALGSTTSHFGINFRRWNRGQGNWGHIIFAAVGWGMSRRGMGWGG